MSRSVCKEHCPNCIKLAFEKQWDVFCCRCQQPIDKKRQPRRFRKKGEEWG